MLGLCTLSAAPMRGEPSHRAEMVNQLLYGDGVEILAHDGEWYRVRSLYDGYEGWVSDKQLNPCDELPQMDSVVTEPFRQVWQDGNLLTISMGASCHCDGEEPAAGGGSPVDLALRLLGAPYQWGGRTPMGIDCSGLVQVVYKACGIRLPRDAAQQATCGRQLELVQARAGDLAFFANGEGHVVHVGIVTGDGHIVHASGEVRRDRLTQEGIFNEERQLLTHRLACVCRVVE